MGANHTKYHRLLRPAKLKDITNQQFLHQVIAYGKTRNEALDNLNTLVKNENHPPIQLIPGTDDDWYCGLVKHPTEYWLLNTIFFETDNGKTCAWFWWNRYIAG